MTIETDTGVDSTEEEIILASFENQKALTLHLLRIGMAPIP